MPRILLVDGGYDPGDLPADAAERYRAAVCLFWLTPSTRRRIEERLSCFTLRDLVTDERRWGRGAYALAERYLAGSPSYRDLPWRRYSMEPVYQELLWLHLLIRLAELADGLKDRWKLSELTLEGRLAEPTAELLETVLEGFPGLRYRPEESFRPSREPAAPSRLGRALRRLREGALTGDWRSQLEDLVESFDPTFRWRARWGRLVHRRRPSAEGIVFLSSYTNNTRSLLPFRDHMPGSVHWILVNRSARRGLESHDEAFWLWAFGRSEAPGAVDSGDETSGDEPPGFVFWRQSSTTVRSWLEVEQYLLQVLTACWERYLDQARPRLVVVANQLGLEGWLAQVARRRGIPVLQVMHGLLGGYFYTETPILTDAMVVYGDVWRGLWPESERGKILAYDPGRIEAVSRRSSPRRRLTFFSWPLETKPFYNAPELHRRYLDFFHRLLARGVAVTVRFHPLENPDDFRRRWRRRHGALPAALHLSKSEPLKEILAETDVALMFRSTVLLDCLVSGIPVVLPGWIDFVWNRELEDFLGVHLAEDFEDLKATLEAWLRDPPAVDRERLRAFLRPPGEGRDALVELVRGLLED